MLFTEMKLNTLDDLFIHGLKDMYNAEKLIMDALPKMIDATSSPELKDKFKEHLAMTREQSERLEEIFDMLDMEPEEGKCDGMVGIIKEGEKLIKASGSPDVKDAGLIAAAQRVEHYEISAYGTLRTFAATLGYTDIAEKLQTTVKQETKTDQLLTDVAERSVNVSAVEG
jgi:ferritin-like metal-binding protein YciE